ncbi:hypothetical protein MCOR02_004388 [Pyricularia oryzae]|uniref:Signal recognition particle subunit SRP72 n=4 Tax=Pyricularia oryzae TaxID=318829 RepID=G4MN04_PYRO7|nr:uncharacterized protein MGG_06904 [Pyricularia oryzae 70-15]ELQ43625.1 hypothetical protein OOU_Y34scaffold00140g33 [Pyricularia oryzae Y34]KAH9435452.1 hypothetical protein MCOR02_004388 [Pyricularia oryzae]EHA57026.1 hypothetical protein MGG_06904 [Pyricularia oryzae 70-15]KAI6252808.1 hypothetical protein MCOR19_010611 [Pyricularia oryzae]KAI6290009.1 hypothetical protein MCOR34_010544 [Pyricularia oryzae]
MADPAVSALNSLLRGTEIDDHDEVLRLANAAIRSSSSPSSPEFRTAQQAKVVALVKLDRYDDALRTIADGGDRLATDCALENAYSLYKTGQLDAAAQVCTNFNTGHSSSMRGARHVAAQVAYRAEKFAEAARSYQELLETVAREGQPGEEGELRINMLAAAAQLEWAGNGHQVAESERQTSRRDMETFETAFNAACGCMARGDYGKAEVLLKRSRALCEASEELSEEEKQAELIPILVQASYVLTRLGKNDAAIECQSSISISDISDESAKFVAQNNSLVLNHGENPYMTARKAETLSIPTGNSKPFECQASILRRNKQVIELQCQKFRGVRSRTAFALKRESPDAPSISPAATNLGVLHAAAVSHLQTGKEALKSILPLLESRPDDIGLLLTIIQLYIQTANPQPGLALLEALFRRLESATSQDHSDVRFAPGLVALAVALYRLQGRRAAIRAELARAATYWQHQTTREAGSATSLLRHAGMELLHSQDEEDLATAGDAFALLCKQQRDRLAEAGLVASFATSDRSRTQPYLDNLTPVDKLTEGVDISALIDAGVAVLTPTPVAGKKRSADGLAATQEPAKKQRRSRAKLPKDYDPDKQPDPERWLPLRDRSTYRPKGKKGKKRVADSTQGGMVKEEGEMLELVGGAGAVKVEKVPQGGAGNKKKKKGKK